MSCPACDLAHDEGGVAYYRWKHANIGMKGCDQHLREVFDALSHAQDALRATTNEKEPT